MREAYDHLQFCMIPQFYADHAEIQHNNTLNGFKA